MKKFNFSFYKSIGFYIFLLYILFTYIPQIFFHIFFHKSFLLQYNAANYNPFLIIFLIVLILLLLLINNEIIPHIKIRCLKIQDKMRIFFNIFVFLLIFLYLVSSVYIYLHYSISLRETHRLRDTSFLVKISVFLKEFVWYYIFLQVVNVVRLKSLNRFTKFNLFLILIGWILSLNASQSIPMIPIILLLFFEKKFIKLINYKINILKIIIIFFFVFIFGIGAIFFGYMDKWGFERTYIYFTNLKLIEFIIIHTLTRLSTSYEAALSLLVNHFWDVDLQLKVIKGFIDTFLYRLSMLTHIFNYPLNSIETVNRFNFFILYKPWHWDLEFAGASPGLLATVFYIPFPPFNFLFLSLYILIMIRIMNVYFPYTSNKFNIFGKLILFYLTFKIYEAPLDFFYIIDPKFLFIFLFVIGSFLCYYNKKKEEKYVKKNYKT